MHFANNSCVKVRISIVKQRHTRIKLRIQRFSFQAIAMNNVLMFLLFLCPQDRDEQTKLEMKHRQEEDDLYRKFSKHREEENRRIREEIQVNDLSTAEHQP